MSLRTETAVGAGADRDRHAPRRSVALTGGHTAGPAVPPALPDWVARGRVPCLDGLRAIAILLVIVGHDAHTPGTLIPAGARYLASLGSFGGVDLFFIISGFLIT